MNLEAILRDFEVNEKSITVQDEIYPYIEAVYLYKKRQYAKYFILDFISDDRYRENLVEWEKKDFFIEFQGKLLEETFFQCEGDTRFNLYLVLLVPDDSSIIRNTFIQKDFRFARKIILAESEVDNFFSDSFVLRRISENNHISDLNRKNEIWSKLRQSGTFARECLEVEFVNYYNYQRKSSAKDNMNYLMELMGNYNRFQQLLKTDKKIKKVYSSTIMRQDDYIIRRIESVSLQNYRCFKRECKIPFKKVNLLYGENGTGKTSLLEAIEFGITGYNRNDRNKRDNHVSASKVKNKNSRVVVHCENSKKELVSLYSNKDNLKLSEFWYGAKIDDCKEFNRIFAQYNYFDTSWASAFAIEGEERVNLLQLKSYLGIERIESAQKSLLKFYKTIIKIFEENILFLDDILQKEKYTELLELRSIIEPYAKMADKEVSTEEKIRGERKYLCQKINLCNIQVDQLEDQVNFVTLTNILSSHIKKIENIFKLLISTNEYSELLVDEDEVVAIRSGTNEKVSMSKMSTGQKVCLALAFMFALYLSNENAPKVIMLDEPVANLDDLHMLNLLDLLRRLALADTQIFFTTANPDVAKLFRRKFSFLEEEFAFYRIIDTGKKTKINCESYKMDKEEPVKNKRILS